MCQWQCLGYPQYDAPTTQDGKTILKVLVRVCKSKTQMPQFIGTVPFGLGSPALPGLGTIPSDGGHHCGTCRLLILHLDSLLMCFFTTLQHSPLTSCATYRPPTTLRRTPSDVSLTRPHPPLNHPHPSPVYSAEQHCSCNQGQRESLGYILGFCFNVIPWGC